MNSVCIADFGLAQRADDHFYLFHRCGTPGFVAPEVVNCKDGGRYEPICDVFSLGLIFYILLTGKPAFPGKSYNDVLAKNRKSDILFEGTLFENVPKIGIFWMYGSLRFASENAREGPPEANNFCASPTASLLPPQGRASYERRGGWSVPLDENPTGGVAAVRHGSAENIKQLSPEFADHHGDQQIPEPRTDGGAGFEFPPDERKDRLAR